jgi:hypothetical protein
VSILTGRYELRTRAKVVKTSYLDSHPCTRTFCAGDAGRTFVDEHGAVPLFVNLLQVDYELTQIMLRVSEDFFTKEGDEHGLR